MEDRIVEKDFGDLAVNMGPQHPSTHGFFRLKLYLQGERINKIESFLGYLHRGVEKLSEKLNYDQLPPVLERDDYLSWCDWTQGADSPLSDSKKAAWATFRQALRDLPTHSNWPDLEEDDWPTEPT